MPWVAASSMTHVLVRTPGVGDSTKSMTWVSVRRASRALVGLRSSPSDTLHGPTSVRGVTWSVRCALGGRLLHDPCPDGTLRVGDSTKSMTWVLVRQASRALGGSLRWTESNTPPLQTAPVVPRLEVV